MKIISNRTWRIDDEQAEKVQKWLLGKGGREEEVKNQYEKWRIKYLDSTITFYSSDKKKTLYITDSNYEEIVEFHKFIDSLVGSKFVSPSKDFLIGLDETGKGEVIGHVILVGFLLPAELFTELDRISGVANTKIKHSEDYWDELFRKIDFFKQKGVDFIIEKIPPWHFDEYNINQLMDLTYQRILSNFFQKVDIAKTRIVIDDYGTGPRLNSFLNFLKNAGAEIIKEIQADEKYLESKLASLVAKRTQVKVFRALKKNPEFHLPNCDLGSGNAGDRLTLTWLKEWWETKRSWPWFIKQSFKTIKEIEGSNIYKKQKVPPLNENILSQEFREKFNSGILDVSSLSLVCDKCGYIIKSVKLAPIKGKTTALCVNCNRSVQDVSFTLRYYCGRVLPDSSVIARGFLSKDLENEKFFENFTFLLHPIIKKESDTLGGKKELERLGHFDSVGRIRLEEIIPLTHLPSNESIVRDDAILEDAKKYNAIIITADNGMKGSARAKNLFIFEI